MAVLHGGCVESGIPSLAMEEAQLDHWFVEGAAAEGHSGIH